MNMNKQTKVISVIGDNLLHSANKKFVYDLYKRDEVWDNQ